MLKNIYFTDFDSKKDEAIVKELLDFDYNINSPLGFSICDVNMEYYFKKCDFMEIDSKLILQHSTYQYANHTLLYYELYDGTMDISNLLFREIRRYDQFVLMSHKDRVIAYNKICYKVK